MDINSYYTNRITDPLYYNNYFSSSLDANGSFYSKIIGTNFRSLKTFYSTLFELKEELNKPREIWKKFSNGQEINKHRVKRFEEAGFITKNSVSYSLSNKGYAFLDLIEKYKQNKRYNIILWFITFIFILNGSFGENNGYLIKRSYEIKQKLLEAGYTYEYILENLRRIAYYPKKSFSSLVEEEMLWLLTFVEDELFLEIFKNATPEEKETLFNRTKSAFDAHDKNDLLAAKYASGSVKSVSQFVDETKMLYYALLLIDNLKNVGIESLISLYCCNENAETSDFDYFLKNHKSIINLVLSDVSELL